MRSEQGTLLQSLCVVTGLLDEHADKLAGVARNLPPRRSSLPPRGVWRRSRRASPTPSSRPVSLPASSTRSRDHRTLGSCALPLRRAVLRSYPNPTFANPRPSYTEIPIRPSSPGRRLTPPTACPSTSIAKLGEPGFVWMKSMYQAACFSVYGCGKRSRRFSQIDRLLPLRARLDASSGTKVRTRQLGAERRIDMWWLPRSRAA